MNAGKNNKKEEKEHVELTYHEEKESESFWKIIKLPWYEYIIVALLIAATITMFILKEKMDSFGVVIGLVICSSLLGLWFAFRPSEWAVDGLDNLMRYAGLTAYVAGVISSLASNLPEAVAAGIMLIKGNNLLNADPTSVIGNNLILTAFYTTLAAAGFNAILLGIVVLVGGKKKGYIEINKQTIAAESVLLRWGFVATLLTFGVGVIEILNKIFHEVKNETFFQSDPFDKISGEMPRMAGIALVVSYLIYLIYLIVKSKQAKAQEIIGDEIKAVKTTRSKLDESMPDVKGKDKKEPAEAAKRKVLDEPDEINIIDVECEETRKTYTSTEKAIVNPYKDAPALERPHVSLGSSVALVVLGIAGIAGGGYLLSHAVETLMHEPTIHISVELMALIVGFSGAIPEHGIAVVAAAKGKTDVALGNILGGILQMTLLIFGAFSIIFPAPINGFMLFQLIAIAGILWFVKRSISDDHQLNSFEGIMIIMAQLFSFILLIIEMIE